MKAVSFLSLWFLVGAVASAEYQISPMGVENNTMGNQRYGARGTPGGPGNPQYSTGTPRDKELRIKGRCIVESEVQIEVPCAQGDAVLYDEKKKKLTVMTLDRGGFRFNVEKKKRYFIGIRSTKYETKSEFFGPFEAGAEAVIKVVNKAKMEEAP